MPPLPISSQEAALPGSPNSPAAKARARVPVRHEISVLTGDKYGAGTDSVISIEVVGDAGSTQHVLPQGKGLFERSKRDTFFVDLPDIGELTSLRVWSDGQGFGSDWYLDSIQLENTTSGYKWAFPCRKWINGGEAAAVTLLAQRIHPPPLPASDTVLQGEGRDQAGSFNAASPQQRPLPRPATASPLRVVSTAARPMSAGQGGMGLTPAGNAAAEDLPLSLLGRHGSTSPLVAGPGPRPQSPAAARIAMQRSMAVEPKCSWQKFMQPHPQQPGAVVTYYYHTVTGESAWEKPADYVRWEAEHKLWLDQLLGQAAGRAEGGV